MKTKGTFSLSTSNIVYITIITICQVLLNRKIIIQFQFTKHSHDFSFKIAFCSFFVFMNTF
jgi:hypothetical protein